MQRKARRNWTKEEEQLLIEIYPLLSSKECGIRLDRTSNSINKKAKLLGLSKSKEWISEMQRKNMQYNQGVRKTWFKPGHEAYMKGKKLEDVLSPEGLERNKASRFKKGDTTKERYPIGYESKRGNYTWVKVGQPNEWEYKHRVVWREVYGEIPKNHFVKAKDGDLHNCNIDNLYLETIQDHLKNNFSVYPEVLVTTWRRLGILNRMLKNVKTKNELRCTQ